ncbi:MAG: RNA-binding S4 domain-containing protein [Erysipelotrichaceae bacterium]
MRLDKYLKVSRILKRRTVSKELADSHRVFINNRLAKPSTNVEIGDVIRILFGNREITVRVTMIQKQVSKSEAGTMFEIMDEKYIELSQNNNLDC